MKNKHNHNYFSCNKCGRIETYNVKHRLGKMFCRICGSEVIIKIDIKEQYI